MSFCCDYCSPSSSKKGILFFKENKENNLSKVFHEIDHLGKIKALEMVKSFMESKEQPSIFI